MDLAFRDHDGEPWRGTIGPPPTQRLPDLPLLYSSPLDHEHCPKPGQTHLFGQRVDLQRLCIEPARIVVQCHEGGICLMGFQSWTYLLDPDGVLWIFENSAYDCLVPRLPWNEVWFYTFAPQRPPPYVPNMRVPTLLPCPP
jgi:hypothetical protein